MPSLLVLDDLDLLCPAPSADPGVPPAPPHADALVQWLTDVLDALRPADGLPYPGARSQSDAWPLCISGWHLRGLSSANVHKRASAPLQHGVPLMRKRPEVPSPVWHGCLDRSWVGAVVVCATCSEAAALPAPLRLPGRLDHDVALPLPDASGRLGMLTAELASRGLTSAQDDLHVRAIQPSPASDHDSLTGSHCT